MFAPTPFRLMPLRALRQPIAWLLWLVLLLPVAQAAANWHLLGHSMAAPGQVAGDSHRQAHAASCELCLVAAAVHAGGLLRSFAALASFVALPLPTPLPGAAVRAAGPLAAYLSRAPPVFLR